jgi:hypothetical protein
MLTIKDLSASKELDVKAMSEVRGGGDVYSANAQSSFQGSAAGLVAVNESTQNLLSSNTAFDYTEVQNTLVGIGQNGGLGIFSVA